MIAEIGPSRSHVQLRTPYRRSWAATLPRGAAPELGRPRPRAPPPARAPPRQQQRRAPSRDAGARRPHRPGRAAPAVRGRLHDEDVLGGVVFYLTEAVGGINPGEEPYLDDSTARHAAALDTASALARLAAVDHAAVGLGDLGRPEGFLDGSGSVLAGAAAARSPAGGRRRAGRSRPRHRRWPRRPGGPAARAGRGPAEARPRRLPGRGRRGSTPARPVRPTVTRLVASTRSGVQCRRRSSTRSATGPRRCSQLSRTSSPPARPSRSRTSLPGVVSRFLPQPRARRTRAPPGGRCAPARRRGGSSRSRPARPAVTSRARRRSDLGRGYAKMAA